MLGREVDKCPASQRCRAHSHTPCLRILGSLQWSKEPSSQSAIYLPGQSHYKVSSLPFNWKMNQRLEVSGLEHLIVTKNDIQSQASWLIL
jgi:hypothetical protein